MVVYPSIDGLFLIMSFIWSILGFIVVMGIIVTVHEWGHYQVARWFNIKVKTFSIGFGKPIYRKQGKETEFLISQIPLGGYVKFADEREGPVATEDLKRAFNRQSVYKRIAVVAAGPIINLILAWLAFTWMYMIGVGGFKPIIDSIQPKTPIATALQPNQELSLASEVLVVSSVNNVKVQSWQMVNQQILQALAKNDQELNLSFQTLSGQTLHLEKISLADIDINNRNQNWLKTIGLEPSKPKIPAVIGELVASGPAELAGLKSGDRILQIEKNYINNWQDFVKVVQSNPGETLKVLYERNGAEYMSLVKLDAVEDSQSRKIGKMGVGVQIDPNDLKDYQTVVQYGFWEASGMAYQRSLDLIEMSLVMLKRMLIGEVSTDNLSGPISIAQFSGQALQNGFVSFLSLLGLLSLSIGILNLLPIPVLDGGHLVFYFIEVIKGTPVSEQTMVIGQFLGLMVILGLTFLAVFNDVLRIFHS
jgi:regulator of sigma E protease